MCNLSHYYRCNNYVARWKTSQKQKLWHHSFQGPWFVQMAYVYAKFRAWCHSFQPFRNHYLFIVVFCLLFSVGKYVKHSVSPSIITRNTDINAKHLRRNCLWCHVQASTQNTLRKTHNYYNDNNIQVLELITVSWNFTLESQYLDTMTMVIA